MPKPLNRALSNESSVMTPDDGWLFLADVTASRGEWRRGAGARLLICGLRAVGLPQSRQRPVHPSEGARTPAGRLDRRRPGEDAARARARVGKGM